MVRISKYWAFFLVFNLKYDALYSFPPLLFQRGMLHSNPMDYAWGANGLDAIITQVGEIKVPYRCPDNVLLLLLLMQFFALFYMQLLNQFENTGPPPADKERIKGLPTISITEEHVGMCITFLLLLLKRFNFDVGFCYVSVVLSPVFIQTSDLN